MEHHLTASVLTIRRLLGNLERLRDEKISAPDLMSEPVLNDWIHGVGIVSRLEGAIEGAPTHRDGQEVRTGQLFAYFEDDGKTFALTLDGWYRLGRARAAKVK